MGIEREKVMMIVETAEMRIAASTARIEARIDAMQAMMDEHVRAFREECARMREEMKEFRMDVRTDTKNLRRTVIVTGISSVLAILFGWSAIQGAMLEHFRGRVEGGPSPETEHEAIRRDIRELTEYIKRLPPPPAPSQQKAPAAPNK